MKSLRKYAACKLDHDRRSRTNISPENCVQSSPAPPPHENFYDSSLLTETSSTNQNQCSVSQDSSATIQLDLMPNPEVLIQPAGPLLHGDSGAGGTSLPDQIPAESFSPHQLDTYKRAPLLRSFTIIEPTTLNQDNTIPDSILPPCNGINIQVPESISFYPDPSAGLVRAPLLTASTIIGTMAQHQTYETRILQGHELLEPPYGNIEFAEIYQARNIPIDDHNMHFLQAFPS